MAISFLFATQRSGTNLLRSILDSHPGITNYPEIFNDRPAGPIPTQYFFDYLRDRVSQDSDAALPSRRPEILKEYFDMIEQAHPQQIVMLDVKYSSLHHGEASWARPTAPPRLIRNAVKSSQPALHLVRNNSLKVLLSELRSKQFARYHIQKGESPPSEKTPLPIDSLLPQLKRIQSDQAFVENALKPHPNTLTLAYEDLWADAPGGEFRTEPFEKIARLLDLPCEFLLHTKLVKTTPDNWRNAVENEDEVAQTLNGTPFEWMLD